MGPSKVGTLIGLTCSFFLLSACVETTALSTVLISEGYLTEKGPGHLVDEVYRKVELLDGTCMLLNSERQVHTCTVRSGGDFVDLSIGYALNGSYSIAVISRKTHLLPPSEKKFAKKSYLPELHHELAHWAISIAPPSAVESAKRRFVGYEYSEELEPK